MCLNMITSHFSIFFLLAQFVSFIIIVVGRRHRRRRSIYIQRYYFHFFFCSFVQCCFFLLLYLHRRGQSPCAETIFRLASFIHFFPPNPLLPSHERASKRARNVLRHNCTVARGTAESIERHNDIIIIIICSI